MKRLHHIVASSYLNGFSEKPSKKPRYSKVSVYDKSLDAMREQATENVATEGNFYAKRMEDWSWDHGTEDFLAEVENRAVPVIRKIASGQPVYESELSDVTLFVTVQSVRWRSYIRKLVSSIAETVSDSLDRLFPDAETAARNMSEWFDNGELLQVSDPERAVRHFSDPSTRQGILDYLHVPQLALDAVLKPTELLWWSSAFRTVDSFEKMFLFAPPGESFTTSDVPVVVIDPDRPWARPGFRKPGIALACPLSKSLYAIFADPVGRPARLPRTATVSPEFVRTANAQSIARCDRFAVAWNREVLAKAVHDHLRASWQPPFARRFRISEGG